MKQLFEGVGVALVTPFKDDKIDFDSMSKLIDKCLTEGADAIITLGTTGEGATISLHERKKIIEFCRNKIQRRAKLIIGTGHNDFKTCFKYTKQAKDLGADGSLVVTPYYNKTTQEGLVKYYEQLAKLEFPIIMYNVPSRTGLTIDLSTVSKIIQTNPYIYGLKESTSDINRILQLHQICKDEIAIYSGEDSLNHIFYYLGSSGCISVTANLLTKQVKQVYSFSKLNNNSAALRYQNNLTYINNALFVETNPIPIKQLLYKQGIIASSEVRMPLVHLSTKNEHILDSLSDDIKNTILV